MLRGHGGFTLIELLVVIGITMSLATIILVYSGTSREQIALSVEVAKLGQVIARAKSLSISTLDLAGAECGYGVNFDEANNRYAIISYTAASCAAPLVSLPAFQESEAHVLSPLVEYADGSDQMSHIFFAPPDPTTVISIDGGLYTTRTGYIYLRTRDGSATKVISVNPGGQISF